MDWINQKIKDRKILFFQIFLSQLVIILELVLPYLEGTIINQLIARNRILLYELLFVLVIAFIARMVVSYFSSKINYSYIPQKSIYAQNEFVKDFYLKDTFALLKNAPSYLHDRVSNDIEEYIKYYYSTIPLIIGECTLIIYVSVFIYGLSFIFFVIFIMLMIIYLLIHRFSQFRLMDLEYRSIELGNRLFSQRNNLYHRLIEIKSKEIMRVEFQRLNHLSTKLNVLINKNFISKYFISSSKIFFSFIIQVMFFVIGGGMIFAGKLTVGYFIIVMQYFLRLLNSLDNMLEFGDEYRKMLIAKKRLLELCDLPNSLEGNILIRKIENIVIHDVKVNIEDKVLYEKPINFSLQKGNIYQITGKNGSGKTSLLLTLTGVYKGNYTGKILVNGYELRDINTLELRKQCISYMMQSEYLQEITVKEYVTTFLSLTEVESILDIPSFQPIFNGEKFNLKKFYENKLNELSGGERQIIQFFVTITKPDTSLLILDESFSNIAAFIDHYLPDLFEELSKHCIILLVTHRPIEKLACKYLPI